MVKSLDTRVQVCCGIKGLLGLVIRFRFQKEAVNQDFLKAWPGCAANFFDISIILCSHPVIFFIFATQLSNQEEACYINSCVPTQLISNYPYAKGTMYTEIYHGGTQDYINLGGQNRSLCRTQGAAASFLVYTLLKNPN